MGGRAGRESTGRLRGRGRLLDKGACVADVDYDIIGERDVEGSGSQAGGLGQPAMGMNLRGQLRVTGGKPNFWMHRNDPFTLVLTDGSTMQVHVMPDETDTRFHSLIFASAIEPPSEDAVSDSE